MNEAEWLVTATDPTPMLECLRYMGSERRLRLFGCAVVRILWSRMSEELPNAVDVAEKYADGSVSKAAMRKARHAVRDKRHGLEAMGVDVSTLWTAYWLAESVATINAYGSVVSELNRLSTDTLSSVVPDWLASCDRLRDIFGNPFRPVAAEPSWLTSDVVALANGIYAERAFDRMPILADALQDAGCDSEDVLNHCRQPGEHVRGCWVVDLVLGKS